MASTRNIDDVIDQIDLEEQQRLLLRTEQERKDREYAERLYREQLETPPRPAQSSSNNRGRGGGRGRMRAMPRRMNLPVMAARPPVPSHPSSSREIPFLEDTRRRNLPVMAARRINPTTSQAPSNGGGPIRSNPRGRRATTSTRGRPRAGGRTPTANRRRNASSDSGLQFNGDRLQARRGGQVIDITDDAYFPESDDDSDFAVVDEDEERDLSSTDSESDTEPEEEEADPSDRRVVSASFIRALLNPNLMRDNARIDPNYQIIRLGDSSDDDESELSDESEDEFGPVRAEPNNIHQEIREEDREMYNRELVLYHDEDEYDVPPPKIPKHKGKPMEPDTTWGDCTICSGAPIKPQGCQKCLQFIGCADCIRRWYQSRKDSVDTPTCPLCRAPWGVRGPSVQLMPTIIKNREKRDKQKLASEPSTSEPSTSAGPSTSSRRGRPSTSTRRGRPAASSRRRN